MWNIEILVSLLPPYALYVFAVGGFATRTDETSEDTKAFTENYHFIPEQIDSFREI